jgi:hypothetical protein
MATKNGGIMHRNRQSVVVASLLLYLFCFVVTASNAIPRYSAAYGQKCHLCHQNPTGGGMRSAYASEYLVPSEMAMKPLTEDELAFLDPQLSSSVRAGADLRTLYRYSDEKKEENNFFQMQSDLYLHLQLGTQFTAYFDRGISGSYELFGMAYLLPGQGYLKIGRFTPAYGWRFADHTAFVRSEMEFTPPAATDVGMEIGLAPKNMSLQIAMINGAAGAVRDGDNRMTFVFRGEVRRSMGNLNVALGGSGLLEDEPDRRRETGGPFAYLGWKRFSWVGEWDWRRIDNDTDAKAMITSHQFAYLLSRGVTLRADYHFLDPDLKLTSGSETKYGAGVDLLITPFFGLSGMVNRYEYDSGLAVAGTDFTQADLMIHFLF